MDNQQRLAILVTASAGAIAVVVASGSFDSWDTIAGLTLVLILGAYGKELDATGRMRIAYGTVWALCHISRRSWHRTSCQNTFCEQLANRSC